MFLGKTIEFFAAILGGAIYGFLRSKEPKLYVRVLMAMGAVFLGYSLGPEMADLIGSAEIIGAFIVTTYGFPVLDVTQGLISDREFIKELIRKRVK